MRLFVTTIIGDNESRYLETLMIYCKNGRLCVCFHTTMH